MEIINCTPHEIVVKTNEKITCFKPSGIVSRVKVEFYQQSNPIYQRVYVQKYSGIENLPEPKKETMFIVSGIVLEAAKVSGRTDCISPATGHLDVERNDKGHILNVPGFVI